MNQRGQLGRPIPESETAGGGKSLHRRHVQTQHHASFEEIEMFNGERILDVSCGREHSAVIVAGSHFDEDQEHPSHNRNALYMFGNDNYGQCGCSELWQAKEHHGNSSTGHPLWKEPVKISAFPAAWSPIQVECGLDHTVVLGNDGSVYACGWNADSQCGIVATEDDVKGNKITYFTKLNIAGSGGEKDIGKVCKISACADCNMALTDKGRVLSWGNSEYGQTFHGIEKDKIPEPLLVESLLDENIVDIAAGGSFSLALNKDGEVFVAGYGAVTGLRESPPQTPTNTNEKMFIKLPINQRFEKIYASGDYCCGITKADDHNALYVWGRGGFGRLGGAGNSEKREDIWEPRLLYKGVKDVSLGVDHALAILA
eukprot:Nk52_evm43s485 gene=Nk52_evmTU43s485